MNFWAALLPLSDRRTDYWRTYNAEAIARRGEADLIVTSCTWYLRYFADAETISPARTEPTRMRAALDGTAPERVLISSLAYRPHRLFGIENPPAIRADWAQAFSDAFPPPDTVPPPDGPQLFYRIAGGNVVPLRERPPMRSSRSK
ncbi:MAG: hypothetical protein U5R46_17815 [Gammaproteobacteria bacterium]|nr:hypothetical protein [Gammaproteobacteria bacterium]